MVRSHRHGSRVVVVRVLSLSRLYVEGNIDVCGAIVVHRFRKPQVLGAVSVIAWVHVNSLACDSDIRDLRPIHEEVVRFAELTHWARVQDVIDGVMYDVSEL